MNVFAALGIVLATASLSTLAGYVLAKHHLYGGWRPRSWHRSPESQRQLEELNRQIAEVFDRNRWP